MKEAGKVAGALRRYRSSLGGQKRIRAVFLEEVMLELCLKAYAEGSKPMGFPGRGVSVRKGLEETPVWGMGGGVTNDC